MSAIVARGLTKHFSEDIKAVDGVDLDIPEGQLYAFLGPNGSGKTTTVRMLTTLLRPTGGYGEVVGLDITKDPGEVRRRIGVALQEAGLDDNQTGRELLELQGHLYRLPSHEVRERAKRLLEIVDLLDAADRRVKTYSGGMQRRLDLAAALMHNPQVVFLDEPTTGLDPISRETIWQYVRQLNEQEGVTFFLTTQYLEEADRLAHDLAIMNEGKIVATGSPTELKASIGTDVVTVRLDDPDTTGGRAIEALQALEGTTEVRAADDTIVIYVKEGSRAIARVVRILDDAAIVFDEISLAHPTLDDVFLQKTGHHIEQDGEVAEAPSS